MKELIIRQPDDFHLHLRQGAMLKAVLPHTIAQFARALIMPNILPPILTGTDIKKYQQEIMAVVGNKSFTPLMTFKVTAATTPSVVKAAKAAGAVAGKLYPEGVTTNSEDGVSDFKKLGPVFTEMEKQGLVLCLHGETPDAFCLDRETAFLTTLKDIAKRHRKLRIVLEHVTTAEAVRTVESLSQAVGATITAHHLAITLDDVIGDKLRPHHFCKPIAKRPEDRAALRAAVKSGNPKFFLGSDSAPHPIKSKECDCGAAGVYTAPILLPFLAHLFEELGMLGKLENFVSRFGAEFYGLPLNAGTIRLVKRPWQVKPRYLGVVSFMANQTLQWQLGGR